MSGVHNQSLGTFPVDTTKTRLQIQGQAAATNTGSNNGGSVMAHSQATKYRGMTHALLRISTEEGLGALYRG